MITQHYIPRQLQNNGNDGGGCGLLIFATITLAVVVIVLYNSDDKLK